MQETSWLPSVAKTENMEWKVEDPVEQTKIVTASCRKSGKTNNIGEKEERWKGEEPSIGTNKSWLFPFIRLQDRERGWKVRERWVGDDPSTKEKSWEREGGERGELVFVFLFL